MFPKMYKQIDSTKWIDLNTQYDNLSSSVVRAADKVSSVQH